MNKHFKQALNYSVAGSLGIVVLGAITGCEDRSAMEQAPQGQNQFIVIEEKPVGTYNVVEQYPTTGPNRAVLRSPDGSERVINEQEMRQLVEQEKQGLENGSSNLVNGSGGGLSLGETLLAVAGGALLGNLLGNALSNSLMKNKNFQNRQQAAGRNMATSRSFSGASKKSSTSSNKRSGFFSSKGTSGTSGRTFGG